MNNFSQMNWQARIRLKAILMIATITLLALSILSYVIVDRIRSERFLRIQNEYHLASALLATFSELEIERILRNIESLSVHRESGAAVGPVELKILSDTRSSVYALRTDISQVVDLQTEYGDPVYDTLVERLNLQSGEIRDFHIPSVLEYDLLSELEETFLALQQTFGQLGRLHVVGHDALQARHLQGVGLSAWVLLAIVVSTFATTFYVIRRGLVSISGLTDDQERAVVALHASERKFRDYAISSADRYWETDARRQWRWMDTDELADDLQSDSGSDDVHAPGLASSEWIQSTLDTRRPIRNVEIQDDSDTKKPRWWRISGVPVCNDTGEFSGYRGVATDITEQKLLADQSRQLQRVDAIGKLTGGVAHDFNNLLAVILGNLELLKETKDPDSNAEFIDAAIGATMRGADLIKNLLSFARRARLNPKCVDLNQQVRKTKNWAARVLPETIEIETSLLANLWEVEVDPASMESALLNLFLNARDAMPDGGKLTIETANVRIDDDFVYERNEDLVPGRFVMIAVTDTGHGIAPDDLNKIFEPFFTSKPVGEGSGLGLSMVHGFVKQSGGAIRVYSELGRGTSFKLYFKTSTEMPATLAGEGMNAPMPVSHNGERVLLVEDDEDVMCVLSRILTTAGYLVIEAQNGDLAFEFFQNTAEPVALVITDIIMPGTLQGPKLAAAIRKLDPDMPFVFMSGYAREAVVHGNGLRPEDVRLMKPVRRTDLLQAVSNALANRVHIQTA